MQHWIRDFIQTPSGNVPRIDTDLTWADTIGSWKSRWNWGRMHFTVEPGLYAVGAPDGESPVLVTANYKMSFDRLRQELTGIDAWILVLDTKGINVWCAAGKGTFGTAELIQRMRTVKLDRVVSHRKLILPQLGAPGVAAHEVCRQTGFRIVYGPIRAKDLPSFLQSGNKAISEMRQVRFDLKDRAAVVPADFLQAMKMFMFAGTVLFLAGGLNRTGYSAGLAVHRAAISLPFLFLAVLCGSVAGPLLLPWVPGRSFAWKGFLLGLAVVAAAFALLWKAGRPFSLELLCWVPAVPALSSYVLLNYTGATTFTSLSGVIKEMRVALPAQAGMALIGAVLFTVGLFF